MPLHYRWIREDLIDVYKIVYDNVIAPLVSLKADRTVWTTTACTLLLRPHTYLVPQVSVDHRAMIAQSAQALNFYLILFTFPILSQVHILLFIFMKFHLNLRLLPYIYPLSQHDRAVCAVVLCGHSAVADCYRDKLVQFVLNDK